MSSPSIRPAKRYITAPTLLGVFALGILLAWISTEIAVDLGFYEPAAMLLGALGLASSCIIIYILHRLDKAERERVARETQRLGWGDHRAETRRRIAEMKAKEATQ